MKNHECVIHHCGCFIFASGKIKQSSLPCDIRVVSSTLKHGNYLVWDFLDKGSNDVVVE